MREDARARDRGDGAAPEADIEMIEEMWGPPPWELDLPCPYPPEVMEHVTAVNMDGMRFERLVECRAVDKWGDEYEPGPGKDLLDARCGRCGEYIGGQETDHAGTRCRRCGALMTGAAPRDRGRR